MNEKEVSEIRRRFRPQKSNISHIRGCYVNEKGEVVSEFDQSVALMPENEAETFLAILKRALGGTLHKNLIDIEFSTQQVTHSEEHALLMALRTSSLKDDDAVHAFFQRAIDSVDLAENYVILLAKDSYDVPYRSADGEKQDDASSDVFSYVVCAICPVKLTKPALSYHVNENEFHNRLADWIVSPPELGFMFPAFDDRMANIYNALYYTKDTTQSHNRFVETLFGAEAPMPAAAQKETFGSVLNNALGKDCRCEVVQGVHNELQAMIEEHKENREEAPLMVTKGAVRQILQTYGVPGESATAFEQQFDDAFGEDAAVSPRNIVDTRQIEFKTPDVTIKVNAARGDLVHTRVIEGAKYILVRADDGAELNGVPLHIE